MEGVSEFIFELGKVLLKVELSKKESKNFILKNDGKVEEKVLLQKIGKFWNQQNAFDRPDGLVVLTTHRLVFLSKLKTITTTTDFLSFPYEDIKNIEKTSIWLITSAIRFYINSKEYVFTFLTPSNTEEIVNMVNHFAKK